ncbi:MAP6 [Branchiostoma lanceolatum]|uniref:MAP6 protein n=1 Tax=Branchiostoma lanceolatum TaxID=7740 RepID=A0A8J9ZZM2_BRALA|nr:MAP6 [Branchiostoma lanceolatum]
MNPQTRPITGQTGDGVVKQPSLGSWTDSGIQSMEQQTGHTGITLAGSARQLGNTPKADPEKLECNGSQEKEQQPKTCTEGPDTETVDSTSPYRALKATMGNIQKGLNQISRWSTEANEEIDITFNTHEGKSDVDLTKVFKNLKLIIPMAVQLMESGPGLQNDFPFYKIMNRDTANGDRMDQPRVATQRNTVSGKTEPSQADQTTLNHKLLQNRGSASIKSLSLASHTSAETQVKAETKPLQAVTNVQAPSLIVMPKTPYPDARVVSQPEDSQDAQIINQFTQLIFTEAAHSTTNSSAAAMVPPTTPVSQSRVLTINQIPHHLNNNKFLPNFNGIDEADQNCLYNGSPSAAATAVNPLQIIINEHTQQNSSASTEGPLQNSSASTKGPLQNSRASTKDPLQNSSVLQNSSASTEGPLQNSSVSTKGPLQNSSASTEGPLQNSSISTEGPLQNSRDSTKDPLQNSSVLQNSSASTEGPLQNSSASTKGPLQISSISSEGPLQNSSASTKGPLQNSSASTKGPLQNSSVSTKAPLQNIRASTKDPLQNSSVLQNSSASTEGPLQNSSVSSEGPLQNSSASIEGPLQNSSVSSESPLQDSSGSIEGPLQNSIISTKGPLQNSSVSSEGPLQNSIVSIEGPLQDSIVSTKGPLQNSIISTKGPLQNSSVSTKGPLQNSRASTKDPLQNSSVLQNSSTSTEGPLQNSSVSTKGPLQNSSVSTKGPLQNSSPSTEGPLQNSSGKGYPANRTRQAVSSISIRFCPFHTQWALLSGIIIHSELASGLGLILMLLPLTM